MRVQAAVRCLNCPGKSLHLVDLLNAECLKQNDETYVWLCSFEVVSANFALGGLFMQQTRLCDGGLRAPCISSLPLYTSLRVNFQLNTNGPSAGPTLGDLMTPGTGDAGQNRLAGLGFGLPTARLTARYFGGNLELVNLPGYGVDAFLNLRHLEDWEWQEGPELQHPVMQVANAN